MGSVEDDAKQDDLHFSNVRCSLVSRRIWRYNLFLGHEDLQAPR